MAKKNVIRVVLMSTPRFMSRRVRGHRLTFDPELSYYDKGVCGCLTEARVSLCLASPVFPVN